MTSSVSTIITQIIVQFQGQHIFINQVYLSNPNFHQTYVFQEYCKLVFVQNFFYYRLHLRMYASDVPVSLEYFRLKIISNICNTGGNC